MKRFQVPPLTEEQLTELEELYQKTKTPRYRTRAQMVLLSAEKSLKVEEIAQIVRESPITCPGYYLSHPPGFLNVKKAEALPKMGYHAALS